MAKKGNKRKRIRWGFILVFTLAAVVSIPIAYKITYHQIATGQVAGLFTSAVNINPTVIPCPSGTPIEKCMQEAQKKKAPPKPAKNRTSTLR
ncbi:MAG: hypothetical protein ACM3IJ_00710 [Candidatus Levyibacteriota bacterium]